MPIVRKHATELVALGPDAPLGISDAGEIERALAAFARSAKWGLIVTSSALTQLQRDLIIGLAAWHKLPAVYFERAFVTGWPHLLRARSR